MDFEKQAKDLKHPVYHCLCYTHNLWELDLTNVRARKCWHSLLKRLSKVVIS